MTVCCSGRMQSTEGAAPATLSPCFPPDVSGPVSTAAGIQAEQSPPSPPAQGIPPGHNVEPAPVRLDTKRLTLAIFPVAPNLLHFPFLKPVAKECCKSSIFNLNQMLPEGAVVSDCAIFFQF